MKVKVGFRDEEFGLFAPPCSYVRGIDGRHYVAARVKFEADGVPHSQLVIEEDARGKKLLLFPDDSPVYASMNDGMYWIIERALDSECECGEEVEIEYEGEGMEERGRLVEGPVAVLVKGQFTEWYSPFYHDPVYGISEEDDNSKAAQALADEGIIGPTLGDYMLCDDVGWLAERQCSMITGSYPEWEQETRDLIVQIVAAFGRDKPRNYHSDKCGDFEIIPYHAEEMPQLSEKSLKFYADLGYGEKLKDAVGKMLKGDENG